VSLKIIVSLIIAPLVIALAVFVTVWVLADFILGALAGIATILFLIFVSGIVLYAIRITLEEDDVEVITHFNKDTCTEITDIRLRHPWWR
jgi:hypothetical protein